MSSVPEKETDQYYFDSYAGFNVHRIMLRDRSRTLAYRDAMYKNPGLFRSKTVLDVGCGTGILSLFAAKSGAEHVYAVEKSGIAKYATKIVDANGYSDTVQIVNGSMEDLDIPAKVDVIISEWMGYCLLYESMLPSVISARDRFMSPGGTMYPNRAAMVMTGLSDSAGAKQEFGFWDDVCGFKLSATKACAICEPAVKMAPESGIVTADSRLINFDLNTVTTEELNVDVPFSLLPLETGTLDALVVWFTVSFEGPSATVVLSTSPFDPETHWAQTVFYLPEPVEVEVDVPLCGRFQMAPNVKNHRDQDIVISYTTDSGERRMSYKMR